MGQASPSVAANLIQDLAWTSFQKREEAVAASPLTSLTQKFQNIPSSSFSPSKKVSRPVLSGGGELFSSAAKDQLLPAGGAGAESRRQPRPLWRW